MAAPARTMAKTAAREKEPSPQPRSRTPTLGSGTEPVAVKKVRRAREREERGEHSCENQTRIKSDELQSIVPGPRWVANWHACRSLTPPGAGAPSIEDISSLVTGFHITCSLRRRRKGVMPPRQSERLTWEPIFEEEIDREWAIDCSVSCVKLEMKVSPQAAVLMDLER